VAELLAVLLAGSEAAAAALGEGGGIDVLLRALAPFKGPPKGAKEARPPPGEEEAEFIENCFDALAAALLLSDNKARFVEAEGIELLLLFMRRNPAAKTAALRTLDFAVTRSLPAAERLVDATGLGALFAVFSGRSAAAARARRGADAAAGEETRAVSLLSALLLQLPRGSRRDRVAAKFVEEGMGHADRVTELWSKYAGRVAAAEAAGDGEEEEEEGYSARLEAGLDTLQQLGLILAQLWVLHHPPLCARLAKGLALNGASLAAVRAVLAEHAANFGDADGEAVREAMAAKLRALARELRAPGEAVEGAEEEAEEAEVDGGSVEEAEGLLGDD